MQPGKLGWAGRAGGLAGWEDGIKEKNIGSPGTAAGITGIRGINYRDYLRYLLRERGREVPKYLPQGQRYLVPTCLSTSTYLRYGLYYWDGRMMTTAAKTHRRGRGFKSRKSKIQAKSKAGQAAAALPALPSRLIAWQRLRETRSYSGCGCHFSCCVRVPIHFQEVPRYLSTRKLGTDF